MAVPKSIRQVEHWMSAGEAGHRLGTSGTWVTRLARSGRIDGVQTPLGWLLEPGSVEKEAKKREARKKKQSEKDKAQPMLVS